MTMLNVDDESGQLDSAEQTYSHRAAWSALVGFFNIQEEDVHQHS